MIPIIETERLIMRGWQESDFDGFAEMFSKQENVRFVGGAGDRQTVWRRMAAYAGHWVLRGYGFWALEEKATKQFVGYAGLWFPEGWEEPEIGWGLTVLGRGKGYASEAALRTRQYAYETLGWKTVVSCIDVENTPSIAIAERLGAVAERKIDLFGRPGMLYRHPANLLNS